MLNRYRLLASAIAGRAVEVAAVARGARPFTDGATIFISTDVSRDHQIAALSLQASLLGAGSLGPEVVEQLRRRSALVTRYLAVEGHRALSVQEHLVPWAARRLIDRRIADVVDSPAASLDVASGRAVVAGPPEEFGTIRPKALEARSGRPAVSGADVPHHVPPPVEAAVWRELDDEDVDEAATHLFSSPVGGSGAIGRLLKRLFGDSRLGGDGPVGADAPTRWARRPPGAAGAPALSTAATPSGGFALPEANGQRYPEWDAGRRRYRPDWCTVLETEPTADEGGPLPATYPDPLCRVLGRLGIELERHRRRPQGDEVDLDAAIEAHVQMAAGSPPDEDVYIDTLRRRRDLSALILLDLSGSAGESSSSGVPVHVHQTAATMALAEALQRLGDRVAVYGFRSQGRSAVHVLAVKRFDEPLGALARRRLHGLVPGAYTRLGAAIRHGSALLERQGGTSRRLLVVVSDGFAYDHGYEPAYGEADARRALAEARRRGIGCLCLSMGAAGDPGALRRVFGTAAHAVVPLVEQLPAVVGPLFRGALCSAEARRRVFVAHELTRERQQLERRLVRRSA